MLDETHDRSQASWVESANDPSTDFPLQNLPLCVFRHGAEPARCGIGIGEYVLDPSRHGDAFEGPGRAAAEACAGPRLNELMALGRAAWSALRVQAFRMLQANASQRVQLEPQLLPQHSVELVLPARIGGFTDFFSSIFHARNAGALFRPDNPLLPNYKYVPVAYHGRASSIRVSGSPVRRPRGQIRGAGDSAPVYAPTRQLDYEAELGALIGVASELGSPVGLSGARGHIFGMCIVNDWSARDIQAWEAQPLGPFLGKSFATVVSPWVVTLEALEPFRVPAFARPAGDPAPLPHLLDEADQALGGLSIHVSTNLRTHRMISHGEAPLQLSCGRFADHYWSLAQMVAHHTSNGCNLEVGDLIGTGTISGAEPDTWGSLLERTRGGVEALALPNGETRTYLEDGDEVVMTARCEAAGFRSIGFGECRSVVAAAARA